MESNQPDEKTLAMLMVIAGLIRNTNAGTGADSLSNQYERAIENIRLRKYGAKQSLPRSPNR